MATTLTMQQVRDQYPQYKDLSDDQLAQGLHQKFYADMPFADFASKIGYSATPVEPSTSEKIANATNGYIDPAASLDTLKGEGDVALTGALNIPHAMLSAVADIYHRATGNAGAPPPQWIQAIQAHLGKSGQQLAGAAGQIADDTGLTGAVQGAHNALESENNVRGDIVRSGLSVFGDLAQVAAPFKGIANKVEGAVSDLGAQSTVSPAASQLGFRAADTLGGKAGKFLAGDSTKPTLVNHNSTIGNAVAEHESGIAPGSGLNYENLEAARKAPSAVYDRVAASLPEGAPTQAGQDAINAGATPGGEGTVLSQAAKADVEAWRQKLLESATGQQRINQLRTLRQEGFTQAGSDVVDQQQIGQAKLKMANALEDDIGKTLPANGDVSLEQFQAARKALAKNFTIQSALRGRDVDLGVLARIQRADPGLLDGHMETAAEFANSNREAVGLPTRIAAPGVGKDLHGVSLTKPASIIQATGVGAAGRALLRGGSPDSILERTRRLFGPQDKFAPLDTTPQPGPWDTSPGAGGPAPAAAGRPGDIPLADLLSHGVEQPAPQGLSLGDAMASSRRGLDLPYSVNAAHAAGDLSLAPEDQWFTGEHPALGDLAAVASQGVPEGIMARTPRGTRGTMETIDYPQGTTHPTRVNNASGESAASLESINRGTRDLAEIDADGKGTDVLKDVTQIDRNAPKGKLIVDKHSGEIISRGGLSQKIAEGLRNRWASQQRLGDGFTSGS